MGGCSLYARATVCLSPSCSGNVLNMAATCDGIGACRMPGLQDCTPFVCDPKAGACTTVCSADSDCAPGIGCVNHSCGPKQNGQPCAQASECKSGQCVDKVCCESACTGGCRSCALVGSLGKCTMVSAGNADPRATCSDGGAAGCGSNGKCDGAGSCQLYAKGTTCAGESCASNVYTGPSSCDGAGRCVTPDALPCSPYVCNGSKCFSACSTDAQCLTPNRCASNSCGQSNNGATCTAANQCKSGFCAQGVCCDKSLHRRLPVLRALRHASGPAPTSRPAPPIRRASARTRGRPPAEPTGSARRAPARSTRAARPARPPPARAGR